jgi:hypothetical protein
MIPPASPSRRRKRRLVAVAAVSLLLSMSAWWYWPRGDARFVGKWETLLAFRDGSGAVSVGEQQLYENGTGKAWIGPPGDRRRVSYFRWRVEGEDLVVGDGGEGNAHKPLGGLHDWVWKHLGYGVVTGGARYRIIDVRQDEIRLDSGESEDIEILKRISE